MLLKSTTAAAAFALFGWGAGVFPSLVVAQAAPAEQAQISTNDTLILIKSTFVALDQANKTGNYTVLRDLSSPVFAANNNAAKLTETFVNYRRNKVDLSGVIVLDPKITVLPEITPDGMLHIAGSFPLKPAQVNFDLLFASAGGEWRLFGLRTSSGSSASSPEPADATRSNAESTKP
jgi:hypothetical protein